MTPLLRPCAYCREDIPARAGRCPRCRERQPLPAPEGLEMIAWALAGAAVALATVATALRLLEVATGVGNGATEPRFLELMAAASFLLLASLTLRRG